jgi:hypothetical protein
MAKRINISVPDELFAKLTELKDELSDGVVKNKAITRKVSSVCQKALSELLTRAEASRAYRIEGMNDGEKAIPMLSKKDIKMIVTTLSGTGPYKKWSRYERTSVLMDNLGDIQVAPFVCPRFIKLMDGELIVPGHEWVNEDEDDRSEMCWSYIEGFFEGIAKKSKQQMEDAK